MPWGPQDASRHNKNASTPAKKKAWAKIATGVLKNTDDEGKAIRIANSVLRKGLGKKIGK